ncbi:hypothetical protein [Nocardioides sp.]|jgi:hypothetical protein|uniref:hypothetical protein n=1 Tax=Nocardioides sp. TaxID=35761 RepID=UPI0031FE6215|nr:hypothetical protein [Nocardioides sp.]
MKHALFAASLVLIAGTAVGCGGDNGGDNGGGGGGDSSAPQGASSADFCKSFADLFQGMASVDPSATDSSDTIKALKDGAANLSDTGTPDGIPADARHGFEVFVSAIAGIDDNADLSSMENLPGVSTSDEKDIEAFVTYAVKECPDALGGLGGLPTDVPTAP